MRKNPRYLLGNEYRLKRVTLEIFSCVVKKKRKVSHSNILGSVFMNMYAYINYVVNNNYLINPWIVYHGIGND